jgi:hypothetical protein
LVDRKPEQFNTGNIGILCFLPLIRKYGIDQAIVKSHYPGTVQIHPLSSILAFIALKLSNVKRYSKDDLWCMDRGSGLFAGLNVLPKTAWFSSYSDRVTRKMNHEFLKQLHHIWHAHGLLSDTWNLDFTSIPYWGEEEPMENNWSGKRGKALASMVLNTSFFHLSDIQTNSIKMKFVGTTRCGSISFINSRFPLFMQSLLWFVVVPLQLLYRY